MNYVDLLIGGTLIISVLRGYSRGIIFTFAKILSYVAGLGVAVYYFRPFSGWLDSQLNLVERVAGFVYGLLPIPRNVMTTNVDSFNFEELSQIVTTLPLPKFYHEQMLTYLDNYQIMLTGSIISLGETIALILAHTLVEVFAFGLLLLGTVIIVRKLVRALSWRTNKSIFGGVNKIAGAALGLAAGLLVTAIVLGLLVPVIVLGQIVEIESLVLVVEQVNGSKLVPLFLSLFTMFQASAGGILPFASGILNTQ